LECNSCRSIMDGSSVDVKEINVGQQGGKADVDAVINDLGYAPFNSAHKIIIFDEAHELTKAAKDLLLKPIENGYKHVYFIFCTNQPEKLRSKGKNGEPFLDRCTVLNFGRVDRGQLFSLLKNVCEFEGFSFTTSALNIIVDESKGVPRNALVWLNQVAIDGTWEDKTVKEICGTLDEGDDPRVLELCKELTKGIFKNALPNYEKVKKDVPVENIRIITAGWFVGCLKRSKNPNQARMYSKVLDVVTQPIYEQGKLAEHKWYNYMFKITDIIASGGKY
jgi:DNA polymerase III gamma/tau subunit